MSVVAVVTQSVDVTETVLNHVRLYFNNGWKED
jgi:hypothetical protein